jgi:capsular polysaccharide biosynthesis protein
MNDMDDAARPNGPQDDEPEPWNAAAAWDIPDVAPDDPGDPARPIATLVSFHYLRAAVRRRWRFCALFALAGVLLGAAFLVANPAPRTATTTLRLTHPEQVDPSGAIATDISLLTTRAVAEQTIKDLGLTITPRDLMSTVKPVPLGSTEVLQLELSAPTDAEAIRRLDKYTEEYLDFRAKQLSAQSDIMIKGYEGQISALKSQLQKSDAGTERSQIKDQILTLQAAVDDQTQRQEAIVLTSRVIDPAAALPPSGLRRVVLVLASGLIGGLAIGIGVVVLRAILSDRLWLRIEVASALNASVPLSVGRLTPLSRLLRIVRFLPWVRALDGRRAVDRQRTARAIEKALPEPGRQQALAIVCLRNSDEMRFGLVAAAVALQHRGRTATIVDLTEAGRVASAVARSAGTTVEDSPGVFRPGAIPSLSKAPSHIDSADWEDIALARARKGVTLILADLDPGVGIDHLTAWTDCVIVAVTAGKSSVELVRTSGDLVRSAALQLRGGVLLRAVRDDVSSGIGPSVGEPSTKTSEPAVSPPNKNVGRPLQQ